MTELFDISYDDTEVTGLISPQENKLIVYQSKSEGLIVVLCTYPAYTTKDLISDKMKKFYRDLAKKKTTQKHFKLLPHKVIANFHGTIIFLGWKD